MPYRYHYDPNQPRVPQGNHDGGQWTDGGGSEPIQKAFYVAPAIYAARTGIQAALALFTWLSLRNSHDKQAVIAFKAREYHPVSEGVLDLEHVKLLGRDEVGDACKRFEEVQKLTDEAATKVKQTAPHLAAPDYGTAVHSYIKKEIDKEQNADFRAEVSYLKSQEEKVYGRKDSIRIDVLEKVKDGTVCVYDIKTGRRGLSVPRIAEIAKNVFGAYPGTSRIIVTEVRPTVPR
jgi:hypothetical protein